MRAYNLPFTIYHGDDFGTTRLEPKWMLHNQSNNLEGVGIYFSPDIEVAKNYGDKICSIRTLGLKIVESRQPVGDVIHDDEAIEFYMKLSTNDESFWYMISDYTYISGPEDVDESACDETWQIMKAEQIRNWQIEMAQACDTIENFVHIWNDTLPIDGLYETANQFYCIIETDVKVKPLNF